MNWIVVPLVTGAVHVIITVGSLPPAPKFPFEGLAEARLEGLNDHDIELPPRFETVIVGVVEGESQLPASTLVGVTSSMAGWGVAVAVAVAVGVGPGVAVCVGDGVTVKVAVGPGVGLLPVPVGDGVTVSDGDAVASVAVAVGCS